MKVDYSNKLSLIDTLHGAEVVLSFIVVSRDLGNVAQKNLIDAAVVAGVKRFAPSEWSWWVFSVGSLMVFIVRLTTVTMKPER